MAPVPSPNGSHAVDSSNAALLLAQPLINYLRGQPLLNEVALKCMDDLMVELKCALTRAPSYYPAQVIKVRTKMVNPETDDSRSSSSCTEDSSEKDSSSSRRGRVRPMQPPSLSSVPISSTGIVLGTSQARTGGHQDQSQSGPWQRQRRRRILMAVDIFTELDDRESRQSTMERYLGKDFLRWFSNKQKKAKLLLQLVTVLSRVLFLPFLTLPHAGMVGPLLGASCSFFTLLDTFCQSAITNHFVAIRCLRTFEGLVLTSELLLFCSALAGVLCFTPPALAMAPAMFISVWAPIIFRDAHPANVRKKTRYLAVGCTVPFIAILAVLYFRLPAAQMCPYRFDFEDGMFMDQVDKDGHIVQTKKSRWSISLLDFMLNRGITVVVYMVKMTYLSFRHPEDCVIVRSRVRLLELVNNTPAAPSSSACPARMSAAADNIEQRHASSPHHPCCTNDLGTSSTASKNAGGKQAEELPRELSVASSTR